MEVDLIKYLDEKFEQNNKDHTRIIERLDHTNGCVAELKEWKSFVKGALTIISGIIVGIAIPLSVYWIKSVQLEEHSVLINQTALK